MSSKKCNANIVTICKYRRDQREGLGLLVPGPAFLESLNDIAMMVFSVHLEIDQLQIRASGVVRQGRGDGPSSTHNIKPYWVTLLLQASWPVVLDLPSSFQPHWDVPDVDIF